MQRVAGLILGVSAFIITACSPSDLSSDQDWYSFEFKDLYGTNESSITDLSIVHKYGLLTAYNQVTSNDSLGNQLISFDFIDHCSLIYEGSVLLSNDTLYLINSLSENSKASCNCNCDYNIQYTIRDKEWTYVEIKFEK